MKVAIWNDTVLARSDRTQEVEGNQYFPPEDVKMEFLEKSNRTSRCPWKGVALYYNILVDGKYNKDAAWYYPHPLEAAKMIKDHIAFWQGVEVLDE